MFSAYLGGAIHRTAPEQIDNRDALSLEIHVHIRYSR